jgi:hypothetical protein
VTDDAIVRHPQVLVTGQGPDDNRLNGAGRCLLFTTLSTRRCRLRLSVSELDTGDSALCIQCGNLRYRAPDRRPHCEDVSTFGSTDRADHDSGDDAMMCVRNDDTPAVPCHDEGINASR